MCDFILMEFIIYNLLYAPSRGNIHTLKGEKTLKSQKYGIEIEFTGLTRYMAAKKAAEFFKTKSEHIGGSYDKYHIKDGEGRTWKIVSDGSITPQKKEKGEIVPANDTYKVELVSPILNYNDIELLQELVRKLRKAGMFVNKSCGLHLHIDGANPHTFKS